MSIRYRRLDANGDYVIGMGPNEFLIDSPDAVAQAILTRLNLKQGEWFLDLNEGTPYDTLILGAGTATFYDQAIQSRILETSGVTGIENYASYRDPTTRKLSVSCTVSTAYSLAGPAGSRLDIDFILDVSQLG